MLLRGAGEVVKDAAVGSVVGLCGRKVWVYAVGGQFGGEAGEGVLLGRWRVGDVVGDGMPGRGDGMAQ